MQTSTLPLLHSNASCLVTAEKRMPTEPPMPGYKGYIPRINVTEKGLGAR